MDLLWGNPEFTDADVHTLRYGIEGKTTVFHATGNQGVLHTETLSSTVEWDTWLRDTTSFDITQKEPQIVVVCTPRKPQRGSVRNSMALQHFPFKSEHTFRDLASKMHLHKAIATLLTHGWSTFSRIEFSDSLGDGISYNLRTQNTWPYDCFLSISYFPTKQKTFVLFHGLTPTDDVELIHGRMGCSNPPSAIFSPFMYMAVFLYIERKCRFDVVESQASRMLSLVLNFGNAPPGSPSPHGGGVDGSFQNGAPSVGTRSSHDPDNMVGLFLDLGHLKTGLKGWRDQISAMASFVPEFAVMEALHGGKNNQMDPSEYLRRTINEYDVMIAKCGMAMEGTSLAYQMAMSHWARRDQNITIRDGKQMKAIALLTMVFLPATFIATFMSIPIVDWEPAEGEVTSPLFYVYFVISVPLTLIVVLAYFWWIGCFTRRKRACFGP